MSGLTGFASGDNSGRAGWPPADVVDGDDVQLVLRVRGEVPHGVVHRDDSGDFAVCLH